jgi:TRAP-type C4-dicarboxylate transport system permease small subunit
VRAQLQRLLRAANGMTLGLGAIGAAAMMVHVTADVAGKAIGMPVTGTLEIVSSYYMVACIFLPLGWVQQQRSHLAVELFAGSLSMQANRILAAFADVALLVFTALLCAAAWSEAVEQTLVRETSEAVAIRIEVWPSRWFPVVGALCMSLTLLLQLAVRWTDRGDEPRSAGHGDCA